MILHLQKILSLTIKLLSVIPFGACVCLVVKPAQSAVILPVVCVQADIQFSS